MKMLNCQCGGEPIIDQDCAGWEVRCECGSITESCATAREAVLIWNRYYADRKE